MGRLLARNKLGDALGLICLMPGNNFGLALLSQLDHHSLANACMHYLGSKLGEPMF